MGWALSRGFGRAERGFAIGIAFVLLAIAIGPPVAAVASEIFHASESWRLLAQPRLWWLFAATLGLALVVTALSVAIGVPFGVAFAHARFPLRRALFGLHLAIAFLPPFLPALGWFHWFGRGGLVGSEWSSRVLFGPAGLVLVLVSALTPIVTLLTLLGSSGVDRSIAEAARLVASPIRTIALILLPSALPAIALGALCVFALAVSELGVAAFLRVDVYAAVVFSRLGGMDFAPGEAAIFVLPLLVVCFALAALERRFAGRRAVTMLGRGHGASDSLFSGRARAVCAALACTAALVSVLPLAALAVVAARGPSASELVGAIGSSPWNGLRAALAAAAAATAIALVSGHALARGSVAGRVLDSVAMLGFFLPSSVLAVGIVTAWNRQETAWLYTGFGILVVGYVARYAAIADRVVAASVAQAPRSLEEAAAASGAGYFRRLIGIVARTGWRGMAGAFALVLVFCLRDLETAALFYPPGGEPLPVRIFTLEANGPPALVAQLSLVHVLVTSAALGLAWLVLGRRPA